MSWVVFVFIFVPWLLLLPLLLFAKVMDARRKRRVNGANSPADEEDHPPIASPTKE